MLIRASQNPLQELISDLMRSSRRISSETGVFELWKHNDVLCPKLERCLNSLLDSLVKYSGEAYDVQGPRDAGTDVFIKTAESPPGFICFQIKSNDDFKAPDLVRSIKAQMTDTLAAYRPVAHYYLVLCANIHIKRNQEHRRVINGELAKIEGVTVVQPEAAVGVLRLTIERIDAIVKRWASRMDSTSAALASLVVDLTPAQRAIAVYLGWQRIFGRNPAVPITEIGGNSTINDLRNGDQQLGFEPFTEKELKAVRRREVEDPIKYEVGSDTVKDAPSKDRGEDAEIGADSPEEWSEDEPSLENDLEALEDTLIERTGDSISLLADVGSPLLAAIVDGKVRYKHDDVAESMTYIVSLAEQLQ